MIGDEGHPEDDFEKLLQEIAFSSQINATHKDVVDSFYINQLLKAIQSNEAGAVEKFEIEKESLKSSLKSDTARGIIDRIYEADIEILKKQKSITPIGGMEKESY